ncbi:2-amino-3-carboxymuconate-6-semialdehyde decarboxylase [[Actinomadura] parvosata subsp. kistnae]|uniref:Amidohydrolase n=1 Tax=[Actinomadura] parvosata subsp. kistnae TaxID=1909395 RepID=A0A1U9ZVM8_9ACTN|nr:amidohydrolase family protein [Nonomuraea sp. ATCC 55076]AQZ62016.1 amidohydrolase [Nonomuraea sp. ATCC 55076]SPL99809.1 2-amino-3-carboxymuconate-6-semialdehyde decarboxylase [Actinomadura parvosata subsp. kistnae]
MITVDVHAHVLLPEIEQAVAGQPGLAAHRELDARRNGPDALAVSGAMIGARIGLLTRAADRLAAMDEAGVDVQIVSPSPSHYHYWAGPELAADVCRLAAEGVAAHVAQAPDRLYGLGLAPLQHPSLLPGALDDALALGLKGVEISSHAPGRELSDPAYEPFWAHAAATGAVIFLHPFGCTLDERLDRFYLSNLVGQPVENAVALSHLIFAGVLDRHPGLRLLAAHGGGYLPYHLGRADHGWRVRPDARTCAREPSSYLRELHFDSLTHDPAALRELVRVAGPERVLLGSDFPFDMGDPDPLAALRAAGLADTSIRGGNAVRLFDLKDPS